MRRGIEYEEQKRGGERNACFAPSLKIRYAHEGLHGSYMQNLRQLRRINQSRFPWGTCGIG